MAKFSAWLLVVALVGSSAWAADAGKSAASVPYPEGYRAWQHVKSMIINPGHPLYEAFGGIHHIYANPAAIKGYATGKFDNGAVIIFDLLEAKTDGNAVVEGKRKVLGVMHRDTAKFGATSGWGFEGFKGDSTTERAVGANAAKACYECHTQKRDSAFVFSTMRK
jgi:hypothetical protein